MTMIPASVTLPCLWHSVWTTKPPKTRVALPSSSPFLPRHADRFRFFLDVLIHTTMPCVSARHPPEATVAGNTAPILIGTTRSQSFRPIVASPRRSFVHAAYLRLNAIRGTLASDLGSVGVGCRTPQPRRSCLSKRREPPFADQLRAAICGRNRTLSVHLDSVADRCSRAGFGTLSKIQSLRVSPSHPTEVSRYGWHLHQSSFHQQCDA